MQITSVRAALRYSCVCCKCKMNSTRSVCSSLADWDTQVLKHVARFSLNLIVFVFSQYSVLEFRAKDYCWGC